MLKETENEEDFFVTFYHLWHFDSGPLAPPPPGYTYDCNFNAICDIKILCAFLLVCPGVHVKGTLMVLFCMIMLNM